MPHDIESILRIQRENLSAGAGSQHHPDIFDEWASSLSNEDTYADPIAGSEILVAVGDVGRLTGFARFCVKEGVIVELWVAPERHGQGVGTALVRECLTRARAAELTAIRAIAPFHDLIEFYQARAFEFLQSAVHIFPGGTSIQVSVMLRPVELPELQEMIRGLEASVEFFAPGPNKNYEKEAIAVRAFLRGLGIQFEEGELSQGADPPDVCFRKARFEVKGLHDKNKITNKQRPIHGEYKAELARAKLAFWLSDLLTSYTPRDMGLDEVIRQVIGAGDEFGGKYSAAERASLDLLVYVNLQYIEINPAAAWPDLTGLKAQGWRSVSFVRGTATSCVVLASQEAPEFLRQAQGKLLHGTCQENE